MSTALALALMAFFPHLERAEARLYARTIVAESRAAGVDPLLTASRAWVESGFRREAVNKGGNYGLMQTRQRIFDPVTNIKLGVKALAYWKNWHREGRCKQHPRHPFWLHYTWGFVIPKKRRLPRSWKMKRVHKLMREHIKRTRKRALARRKIADT